MFREYIYTRGNLIKTSCVIPGICAEPTLIESKGFILTFADVLEEGKEGSFDVEEIQPATNAILLATNSVLPYSVSANELGKRKELEKKISKIADLILIGLIKRS